MSYWVYLIGDDEEPLTVENHAEGGTFCAGGTTDAELNVTYNYGRYFSEVFPDGNSLGWLADKKAADTIEVLEKAVQVLGTERDSDYWAATPGNAGYALSILLAWAKQYPEGKWVVH